jgi:hypothetical protein
MNAIFWLHVGQSGKHGGTLFEDMLDIVRYQACGAPVHNGPYVNKLRLKPPKLGKRKLARDR